jgi:molybdopterin converting factor subunit 1
MQVKVLFFAAAREVAGTGSMEVSLEDDATVGQLQQALIEQFPGLIHVVGHSAVSVDHEYANPDRILYHGAEVAILPPSSGG